MRRIPYGLSADLPVVPRWDLLSLSCCRLLKYQVELDLTNCEMVVLLNILHFEAGESREPIGQVQVAAMMA
jgi:hypothetical protein